MWIAFVRKKRYNRANACLTTASGSCSKTLFGSFTAFDVGSLDIGWALEMIVLMKIPSCH